MRYRSKSESVGSYKSGIAKSGRYISAYNRIVDIPMSSSKEIWDIVTPGFKRRSAAGEIINSPMTYLAYVPSVQSAFFRLSDGRPRYSDGSLITNYDKNKVLYQLDRHIPVLTVEEMRADAASVPLEANLSDPLVVSAVNQAYADLSKADINALASLGELPETIKWAKDTLIQAFKILKAAKKLRIKELGGLIKGSSASDRYMELRYAIRPLMCDMKSITEAISSLKAQAPRLTSRGYEVSETSSKKNLSRSYAYEGDLNYERQSSQFVVVRAGVLAEVAMNNVLHTAGVLGFDRPIEAIWELVPFSFIVDWFFNVGTLIAAFTPNAGIKELASWVSVISTNSRIYTSTGWTSPSGYRIPNQVMSLGNLQTYFSYRWEQVGIGQSSYSVKRYQRIPDAQRRFQVNFDLNLDVFKIADLGIISKKIFNL